MTLRTLHRILVAAAATFAVVCGGFVATSSANAAPSPSAQADPLGTLASDVSGSFTDAAGGTGTFAGEFIPSEFTNNGDDVLATGQLSGTLTDSTGAVLGTVSQEATTSVDQSATFAVGCEILNLILRPIDLNLLGLTVHLDTVHLVITAMPGAGNLLGNLLCAVVGLLDGIGIGAALAALLNQILGLLSPA